MIIWIIGVMATMGFLNLMEEEDEEQQFQCVVNSVEKQIDSGRKLNNRKEQSYEWKHGTNTVSR